MFPYGNVDHRCLWRNESKLLCSSITCYLIGTGTCTHLNERAYLLIPFRDIYHHMYLKQCGKNSEVDLISCKATNWKQDKIFFHFSYLGWGLNTGLLILSLLPCYVSHHTSSSFELRYSIRNKFQRLKISRRPPPPPGRPLPKWYAKIIFKA